MSSFEIFKNALVYSVCAQIVDKVVQTSYDANSLVILIVVFAFIIKMITALSARVAATTRPAKHEVRAHDELERLFIFLVQVSLNIAVQFESTLIGRVTVSALSPASDHLGWVAILAIISLMLLWLLNESLTQS